MRIEYKHQCQVSLVSSLWSGAYTSVSTQSRIGYSDNLFCLLLVTFC